MDYQVEKDWITAAGLRAVVIISRHRCGYVGVAEDSCLFGKSYFKQIDEITTEQANSQELGKKSPILLFTATADGDSENSIRRSLDIICDVHGGLTYSSSNAPDADYPVKSSLHWFGFDCGHYGDTEPGGQALEYCIAECESLATQLKGIEFNKEA
jgi:hypothetical protein